RCNVDRAANVGLVTFAINVTLDGCCDHREGIVDDEMLDHFTQLIGAAGAMLAEQLARASSRESALAANSSSATASNQSCLAGTPFLWRAHMIVNPAGGSYAQATTPLDRDAPRSHREARGQPLGRPGRRAPHPLQATNVHHQ